MANGGSGLIDLVALLLCCGLLNSATRPPPPPPQVVYVNRPPGQYAYGASAENPATEGELPLIACAVMDRATEPSSVDRV